MPHTGMEHKVSYKKILAYLGAFALVAATITTLRAASTDAPAGTWLTSMEEAQELAQEQDKPILIKFTGSDWCPPCIMLNKNVFSQDTFAEWADKNVVLVYADFPKRKEISTEQKQHNEALADRYKIKGFPTVVLTDAEGEEIARTGFRRGDAESYTKHLDELIAKTKE